MARRGNARRLRPRRRSPLGRRQPARIGPVVEAAVPALARRTTCSSSGRQGDRRQRDHRRVGAALVQRRQDRPDMCGACRLRPSPLLGYRRAAHDRLDRLACDRGLPVACCACTRRRRRTPRCGARGGQWRRRVRATGTGALQHPNPLAPGCRTADRPMGRRRDATRRRGVRACQVRLQAAAVRRCPAFRRSRRPSASIAR